MTLKIKFPEIFKCPKGARTLTDEERRLVYRYADSFSVLADEFDLGLWAVGGTALGAARSEDVIPWDDDVDYAVREEDRGVVESRLFVERVNSMGYEIFKEPHNKYGVVYHLIAPECGKAAPGMTEIKPNDWGAILKGRHPKHKALFDICSDIFLYRRESPSTYNLLWEGKEKKNQSVESSMMGRCRYRLGESHIYSFCDLPSYLNNTFGKNWGIPRFTHNHRPTG